LPHHGMFSSCGTASTPVQKLKNWKKQRKNCFHEIRSK